MKFLTSSSSSAASTTTTTTTSASFDGNVCNSRSAGCLAGMLRRLLCFNSLPTHPSDQTKVTDVNSVELDKLGCLETEDSTPGIVARLMGLESMPRIDFANTQMTPNPIARSQSMNYDSWRESESIEGQHRRVKTSLSFRELPTFLELEDFFVLSFENVGENKEFGSKANRSEKGSGKLKRRKAERCRSVCDTRERVPEEKDKENQDPIDSRRINNSKVQDHSIVLRPLKKCNQNSHIATEAVKQSKPINHQENSNGGKQRKEKEENVPAAKKVETECNSENSSPVSVLDFSESIIDPKVPTSEEDARLPGSNSRRKLSAELEIYEHSIPCKPSSSTSDVQKRKTIDGKCHGSRKKEFRRQNYVEMWGEICKMAEGDMKESNWVHRELWKLEDFEGFGAECELQILENLLNELVDQLVETSQENF